MITAGIDLGGTSLLMHTENNGEIFSKNVKTGPHFTAHDVKNEIHQFLKQLPFEVERVGMAIPGLVNNQQEVVISDVLPHIAGMDTTFLQYSDTPFYLINDVKAALIEATEGHEEEDSIVIMIGTGIAAGIRQSGQFVNGCRGWAGELGSIPIPTESGIKSLDELASGASILKHAGTDAATFARSLETETAESIQIVQTAGHSLGLGLSTVINLLNPQRLVLGGGTLKYAGYLEAALKTAQTYTLPQLWEVCEIKPAEQAETLVARGASRFALLQS